MLVRPSVLRLLDRMSRPARPRAVGEVRRARLEPARRRAVRRLLRAAARTRRNLIRQRFLGTGIGRVTAVTGLGLGGRLRRLPADRAGPLPRDPDLARLIADLRAGSARFDDLWRAGRSGRLRAGSTTIEHPELGPLTLDCDVLLVPESDQTLLVYSAAPGTPSASALGLLRVTGLEQFSH